MDLFFDDEFSTSEPTDFYDCKQGCNNFSSAITIGWRSHGPGQLPRSDQSRPNTYGLALSVIPLRAPRKWGSFSAPIQRCICSSFSAVKSMATKTELEQQVAELQAQLAAAQSAPDAAPRLPGLAERIWLPKSLDEEIEGANGSFKTVKQGKTPTARVALLQSPSGSLRQGHQSPHLLQAPFHLQSLERECTLIKDLIEANDPPGRCHCQLSA